jgi:hypothetical protein
MTSTVSTTVKIVVSMVVVAALVATTFNSKVRTIDRGLAIILGLHRQTDYCHETYVLYCALLSKMMLI